MKGRIHVFHRNLNGTFRRRYRMHKRFILLARILFCSLLLSYMLGIDSYRCKGVLMVSEIPMDFTKYPKAKLCLKRGIYHALYSDQLITKEQLVRLLAALPP